MIELRAVRKTYLMGETEVKALDGVSLSIRKGEFLAVMGQSGSGKSTLMHIIGLLDRPDSGSYHFSGHDLMKLSDREVSAMRNSRMGFVFQQFHLLPRMTAIENVRLPLVYAGHYHDTAKALEKIEQVGLTSRRSHNPTQLSGGQQQRVAIARALVNDPEIILADEPTGNLDSKSKEEIMGILKALNAAGKTLIVVTHENEIAREAKRVITMRDGKIVSDTGGVRDFGTDKNNCAQNAPGAPHGIISAEMGWEKLAEYIKQSFFSIFSHKMRSLLSILGILIGVAAVIAMLALGQGAKASIEKQLAALGANLLVVRPGSARLHHVAMESGTTARFDFQDAAAISRLKDTVKLVCTSVNGRAQVVYGANNWNTQVEGTDEKYETVRSAVPVAGKFFTYDDVKKRAKVALLGLTVARELFGEQDPVGKDVKINLLNFKVIGVLPSRGGSSWRDQDDIVIIPVTTAMYRLLGKDYVDSIYVEVRSRDDAAKAQEDIAALLEKRHRLITEEQKDSFQIRNMADIRATMESTTKTMSLLLGCIAAISLLVGGIGIMNIMLVSVTERTREIGLRKAIGATDEDIMAQFLCESIIMSVTGGLAGVCVGVLMSLALIFFAGWTVTISAFSVILSTVFSLMVGVVFGIWPAFQASKLDPIEALRYE